MFHDFDALTQFMSLDFNSSKIFKGLFSGPTSVFHFFSKFLDKLGRFGCFLEHENPLGTRLHISVSLLPGAIIRKSRSRKKICFMVFCNSYIAKFKYLFFIWRIIFVGSRKLTSVQYEYWIATN